MRYCFECSACGSVQEWIGPFAEKPEDLGCQCGQRATQVLGNFSVVVRRPSMTVSNTDLYNRALGRAAKYVAGPGQRRKRREKRAVEMMRGVADEQKRSCSKRRGIGRLVASMPVRYVHEHNLDRGQGWLGEQSNEQTKKQLKQDGLWFGD